MNCRPGDLAIMVDGEPENIGIVLRVTKSIFEPGYGFGWYFEDASRPVAVFSPDSSIRLLCTRWDEGGGESLVCDWQLRPITPPAGTITTDEVIELYAPKVPAKEEA